MPAEGKINRIPELDALRGIAVLLVILFHFTLRRSEGPWLFELGVTGVELFFMISGFVIFMSLGQTSKSAHFIINRIARLYPTYWASVTFTFLLMCVVSLYTYGSLQDVDLIRYLGNMTMFQHFLRIENLDFQYWTMIVEMLFYIVMVILFHFRLLNYVIAAGIVVPAITLIAAAFWGDSPEFKLIIEGIPLLKFIPLFNAGIIFYKLYSGKNSATLNYVLLLACLVMQVLLFDYSGPSRMFISQAGYTIMLSIYFIFFLLFVIRRLNFIVLGLLLFFGKISFALYLVHHYFAVGLLIPLLTAKLHLNFWLAAFGIAFPASVLVAMAITNYIELPMGKLMKTKLRSMAG